MTRGLRLGVVDDHPAISAGVRSGLAALLPLELDSVEATSVDGLLETTGDLDVVVLDVRLADGSLPEDNIRRIADRCWPVLLYTVELNPVALGRFIRAGAMGVVGKNEDWDVLADAVRTIANGEPHLNADLAAAIEDTCSVPDLTARESEVLRLYATGLPMKSVARRVGIAEETAKEYLVRLRRKYVDAGRPAPTKTHLYLRAVEDGHIASPDVR